MLQFVVVVVVVVYFGALSVCARSGHAMAEESTQEVEYFVEETAAPREQEQEPMEPVSAELR